MFVCQQVPLITDLIIDRDVEIKAVFKGDCSLHLLCAVGSPLASLWLP